MKETLQTFEEVFQHTLFTIAGTPINLSTVIVFAIIVIVTFWTSHILQRGLRRFFIARGVKSEASIGVGTRLLHYTILSIGVGVGLNTIGINLTTLFAAGAVFAVGFGFAMQNIAQNFVAGVILIAERTIKQNDILEVDGKIIRVEQLGARSTVGRTLDEEDLIVPNSILVQSTVKNYTLRDALYRLRASVGVTYGSDMKLVREVLEKTAQDIQWKSSQKEPVVLMAEFGDSSVNFEVSVWIEDPWQMRSLRSNLHEAIWWALKDAGIIIAFPQLDVHFDQPVVTSLESMGGPR